MSEKLPKMSIDKMESLVNQSESGEIEVLPNGDVVRLNVTESLQKNLRLERERNETLLGIIKRQREVFKTIAEMAKLEGQRFEP